MLGLRTSENHNFINYFNLVQAKASELDKVFFLDFGQCDGFIFDGMEIDTLFGWLIPYSKVDQFNEDFIDDKDLSDWNDYSVWVNPEIGEKGIEINFD